MTTISAMTTRSRLFAGLAPLGASCLWGGMYVVSKATFQAIPPLTLGMLRLLIGSLTLILLLWIARRLRPAAASEVPAKSASELAQHARWRMPVLGLCIAACITTQFMGTSLATAHEGALLTTVTPVFIAPLAWLFLGERLQLRIVLGLMVALVGLILVVGLPGGGAGSGPAWIGDALLLTSALAWSLFTVLGTPLVRQSSALHVATYSTLWSLLFFAPLACWELLTRPLPSLTPASVGSVLYLGIGATALAWLLWYKGVERLPASVAAVFFFAQPLVGGLLSALILHETLSSGFWLGGLVLAAGTLLVSW